MGAVEDGQNTGPPLEQLEARLLQEQACPAPECVSYIPIGPTKGTEVRDFLLEYQFQPFRVSVQRIYFRRRTLHMESKPELLSNTQEYL